MSEILRKSQENKAENKIVCWFAFHLYMREAKDWNPWMLQLYSVNCGIPFNVKFLG
jgi:hypothetical protein